MYFSTKYSPVLAHLDVVSPCLYSGVLNGKKQLTLTFSFLRVSDILNRITAVVSNSSVREVMNSIVTHGFIKLNNIQVVQLKQELMQDRYKRHD